MDFMSNILMRLLITIFWFDHTTARIPSVHKHEQHKRSDVGERSILLTIATELLSHVVKDAREKRDAEENSVVADLARESVTLGLMAYMAFEHEDECIERLVCDVTERLTMMTSSTGLLVTAAQFVTPQEYKTLVAVAKDAVNGAPCFYYRCGALQYHPVDETESDTGQN